jgi:plastocyanin
MKKTMFTLGLALIAMPAFAKEVIVREVSDPAGNKPYYFSPANLTIQPGDTVTFVNDQEDSHDVMFVSVPKGVDEMIMSPMLEKEGDKFSYTFTVPGTYQFHCHPHEELGMKGTLIVGRPSKPGETVAMDHHKLEKKPAASAGKAEPAKVGNLVQATGKLNGVDAAGRTINITHDPIKALGWPKMKMQFAVAEGVDLGAIKAGDAVYFGLEARGDDYVVTTIKKAQ